MHPKSQKKGIIMKTVQIEGITSSQLQELFNDLGSKIEDLRNDIQDIVSTKSNQTNEYLTTKEACEYLHVSSMTLRRWSHAGILTPRELETRCTIRAITLKQLYKIRQSRQKQTNKPAKEKNMKIINKDLFLHVIKTNIQSGKPVELTSEEIQYFKCDTALERVLAEKTSDFLFSQSCYFKGFDGKLVSLELTFDLMNRTEFQVMLITTPKVRTFLQSFFNAESRGKK